MDAGEIDEEEVKEKGRLVAQSAFEKLGDLLGFCLLAFFLLLAGVQALFAGLAFFLSSDAAAMSAFLALGFGLFATSGKLLLGLVLCIVVRSKSRNQKGERANGNAQEFDEFHSFDV